ncbi:MAG: PKD domain-containing protein [Limisphaerales bacterium]
MCRYWFLSRIRPPTVWLINGILVMATAVTKSTPTHTYTNVGAYTVTLTAMNSAGTNSVTIADYIVVTNPAPTAQIVVSPASFDFGVLSTGVTAQASFVVSNAGEDTLTGFAAVDTGEFSILSGTPFTIAAMDSTNVLIQFVPSTAGIFSNTITFISNGGNLTNRISGRAIAPIILSPTLNQTTFHSYFSHDDWI